MPMKPAEMATALGKKRDAVKMLLWCMADKGLLQSAPAGAYAPPVTGVTAVTSVEADEDEEEIETPWDQEVTA